MRLSLRNFCSSSVSNEPSSTTLPANASTLKAIGRANLSGSGNTTAPPSWVSSAAWSATWRTCLSSSSTPASPAPDTAWYVLTTRRVSPASSCSGLSTGIAAMVVQLGLAMMPLRASAMAPGLTSDTTSGTSGSMRNAEELSMTVTPAAANLGASSRDDVAPAENRAMSSPDGSAVGGVLHGDRPVAPRQRGPRRPRRGEEAELVEGESPLGEQATHDATDLTSCTDDTDTHGRTG